MADDVRDLTAWRSVVSSRTPASVPTAMVVPVEDEPHENSNCLFLLAMTRALFTDQPRSIAPL